MINDKMYKLVIFSRLIEKLLELVKQCFIVPSHYYSQYVDNDAQFQCLRKGNQPSNESGVCLLFPEAFSATRTYSFRAFTSTIIPLKDSSCLTRYV
jgi:hypothetical protein